MKFENLVKKIMKLDFNLIIEKHGILNQNYGMS